MLAKADVDTNEKEKERKKRRSDSSDGITTSIKQYYLRSAVVMGCIGRLTPMYGKRFAKGYA